MREGQELVLLDSALSVNQEIFRVRADLRIEWSPTSLYGREDRRTDQYWPFCTEDLLPSFKETGRIILHPNNAAEETEVIVLVEATGDELPVPFGGLSMRHLLESDMHLGKARELSRREYNLRRSREDQGQDPN